MSDSAPHTLNGVSINVESLFAMSFDFTHLKLTITTILEALAKQSARADASEAAQAQQAAEITRLRETIDTHDHQLAESRAAAERASQSIVDLTKRADAKEKRIEALEKQVNALQKQVLDGNSSNHSNANSTNADSQQRIANLEKQLKALQDQSLAMNDTIRQQGEQLGQANNKIQQVEQVNNSLVKDVDGHTSKIASLEDQLADAMNLAQRALQYGENALATANSALATANAASATAQDAAKAAAEASGKEVVVHVPAPAPVVQPEPIILRDPSHNYDAIEARMKKLTQMLEALSTRVALLEHRPVYVPSAQAPPATTSAPTPSANQSSIDPSLLTTLQQATLQTSRQLSATLDELKQIQATLAALERAVGEKASKKDLADKADRSELAAHDDRLKRTEKRVSDIDRALDELRARLRSLEDGQSSLSHQLSSLLASTSCGLCHTARPTVECNKCQLSFCDECDEEVHGARASEDMQKHLRTPCKGMASEQQYIPPTITSQPSTQSQPAASIQPRTNVAANPTDLDELRRWCEDMFNMYARKEKATRGDIHELYTKEKELRTKIGELLAASGEDRKMFEELMGAIKKLEHDLRQLINTTASQGRNYTDNRIEELLLKLRELERALERGMKSELKRFERDVIMFMEQANGQDHGSGDAAVGKIHFRCLSCDQQVNNLQGPSTLLYARAVGSGTGERINPNATNMK